MSRSEEKGKYFSAGFVDVMLRLRLIEVHELGPQILLRHKRNPGW